jgi:hypothetical protein
MTEQQFMVELRIVAYIDQIVGFPVGRRPAVFFPIVSVVRGNNQVVDRQRTLQLPQYARRFTREELQLLLTEDDQTGISFSSEGGINHG